MATKLFIVESPTKISTIRKFLQNEKDFVFFATLGHIMDLPEDSLGVNLETFEPNLLIIPGKKKLLKRLAEIIKEIKQVYLATDPDREGEAISYHLKEYLSRRKRDLHFVRLELLEITENGLKEALRRQRDVDKNLYQSWKARRVLDRLIGYTLSPYLSRLFQKPLSAGRVQTPALRLIVEREEEIEKFVPKVTYSLKVKTKLKDGTSLTLELFKGNEVFKSSNKEELLNFFNKYLKERQIYFKNVVERVHRRRPPLRLKTSTLIEVAGKSLGFSPKRTMCLAQDLYEEGFITYMRTDSTRVSALAKKNAMAYIERIFGREYLGKERRHREGPLTQGAHECIRPTDVEREYVGLSSAHQKLYTLIRVWFLASFMRDAEYLERRYYFGVEGLGDKFQLVCFKKALIFDGFLRILGKLHSHEEVEDISFPEISPGESLKVEGFELAEHRTSPPERYTPHSLIKKLEALGIGRPSTYSQIVENLMKRGYVVLDKNYLKPTELGRKVCKELIERAPLFVDYSFTSEMEKALDEIRETERDYREIVGKYYEVLKQVLSS